MAVRDMAHRKYKRHPTSNIHVAYKQQRNRVSKSMRSAKLRYTHLLYENLNRPAVIWEHIRGIGIGQRKTAAVSIALIKPLNEYFVSTTSELSQRKREQTISLGVSG